LLVANFPQMNCAQIQERLRQEMLRRIQRGTLSVSLLSRQSGYGQPHLSNFLRGRRQLSPAAMDRILAAQRLSVADLLPALALGATAPASEENGMVPLVAHAAALFEPNIRDTATQSMLWLPASFLASIRSKPSSARRKWQRFAAVRIDAAEAPAMEPLVQPDAIALVDRHYNSFVPYRADRLNLYAVRQGSQMRLRYADFNVGRLVLRPHNTAFPVELIDAGELGSPFDAIAGRVALLLNEV